MNRALWTVIVVAACREKHVPYSPPPPDDAAAIMAIDAPPAIDAAVAVERPRPVKVATGEHFSCALLSDAKVRCWGKNSDGQLGDGTSVDRPYPVTVPMGGVVDIALGAAHVCALLDDSSVTCWGRINKPTGVQGAKRIFAVDGASCASLTDASLVCWGNVDAKGHVRRSEDAPARRAPTPVPDVSNVIAVTTTGVLREDGTASWFGDALTLSDVTEIAAEGDGLCGLRRDGIVVCAGPRHCEWKKKTPVPAIEELALASAKELAFDEGTCVTTRTGKRQCLAKNDGCKADAPVPRRTFPRGSASHVCTSNAREIVCLGSNKFGALGRGDVSDRVQLDQKAVSFPVSDGGSSHE